MNEELQAKLAIIQRGVLAGPFGYAVHGDEKRDEREISREEVVEAILSGEIIEDYPTHHYGPLCLILGWTAAVRPLHVLASVAIRPRIVTVYEPDPERWERDLKTRRPKQ